MRAKEFIVEGKTYKPFLEQLKDVLYWMKTEFVKNQLADRDKIRNDIVEDFMKKMIKATEEALATNKPTSARRLMRAAIPNNQVLRDAEAKARATPSRQNFPSGGYEESKRRYGWLRAVRFGKEVQSRLNFDKRLDKPPLPKNEIEEKLKELETFKAMGGRVPYSIVSPLKFDLKRHEENES